MKKESEIFIETNEPLLKELVDYLCYIILI